MRLGFLTRLGASVVLALALIVPGTPALAASILTGIGVVAGRAGSARVALTFTGGIPAGWTISGSGGQNPTILLPATTQGPSVSQMAYAGVGGVSSVSLAATGNTLAVTLHLTAPLRISTNASNTTIVVDVAPAPAAAPTPGPLATPVPSGGGLSNGENYEIVPLKYADVSEVVGLLVQGQQVTPNDVFQPEGSIFSLPTTNNGIPTQATSPFVGGISNQTPTSVGERVNDNVGYDRRLNAIILYGSADQIAQYKAFIRAIDIPVPSVMLECAVLELDETAAKNLGIDFTNPQGAVAAGAASLGPLNNPASGNLTAPNLTASLQASLYATISKGGGKILATPRILALNGQPAQILSGDALPISSTTTIPGGASAITQSTINYVAVGINMQIEPRIDPDGYVTSHIYAEASSVTQYVNTGGQSVPQISLRQVNTEATVKDGQPYILGGLLLDEEITNLSKIPGIGDLPLIGGFFRVRHDTTQRTNLYIIITPHIIHQLGVPNEQIPHMPMETVPGPLPTYGGPTPDPSQAPATPAPAAR